jgi:hypothetical protein
LVNNKIKKFMGEIEISLPYFCMRKRRKILENIIIKGEIPYELVEGVVLG